MLIPRSVRARLLLPLLVAGVVLGGCSTDVAGTAAAPAGGGRTEAGTIDAARAGLASWLQENRPATVRTSTDIDGCPLLELSVLQSAMAAQGVTDQLQDWSTEIEWNQYTELDPELMGVVCGADSDGDSHDSDIGVAGSVTAIDLTDRATFDDLVALYDLTTDRTVELAQLPDGRTAGACTEEGCLMFWGAGDGLVLGAYLIGVEGADLAAAAEVLDSVGPAMLSAMAEH